jgi:NET1-associated nuclear protein 1 (U3 small nucleolar RNA-associated protein 17)
MATIDKKDDGEYDAEVYLKFWSFDPNTQTFVVNTRIDMPHSDDITSLVFCPNQESESFIAVTSSLDKTFKVWELNTAGSESKKSKYLLTSSLLELSLCRIL